MDHTLDRTGEIDRNIHRIRDATTQRTLDRLVSAIANLAETAQPTEERRTQEAQRVASAYHTDHDVHHEEYRDTNNLFSTVMLIEDEPDSDPDTAPHGKIPHQGG